MATQIITVPAMMPRRSAQGIFVMAALLLAFGFWVIYPIAITLAMSFNAAPLGQDAVWTFQNWVRAWSDPGVLPSIWHTVLIYLLYTSIGFPIAIFVSWALARTKMPFSHTLEFMFWISFMLPNIATTVGWTFLLDPDSGLLNVGLSYLGLGPINIYSVAGIVFAHLMANGISQSVMLLTPAFRNMDMALEEAGRISGSSTIRTMFRVTLPLMMPPILVVFMLKMARMMQSFEIEQILGTPINFFIYSTKIYNLMRLYEPPQYGTAAALASLTLLVVVFIIIAQRKLLGGRQYTTVTGQFKPGVVDLGRLQPVVFTLIVILVAMLTVVPTITLIGGSFMTRVGFFEATPMLTTQHWASVLNDRGFIQALLTTLIMATSTAIISPILFAIVAYVLVRTNWPGRAVLDSIFWLSAAVPGILSGLGLLMMFLETPVLQVIYGTTSALVLVVLLQGKLTATQLLKSVFMQMGKDLEEAARTSGAGFVYTFFRIWLPLIKPTLIVLGVFNFVTAANTTSSIVLLATRDTLTLSIMTLELMTNEQGRQLEAAGIISLIIIAMTAGVALVASALGFRVGLRNSRSQAYTPDAGGPVPTNARGA